MYHTLDRFSRPALVNGTAGIVVASGERIYAVMGFTVADGKMVAIDIHEEPPAARAARSHLSARSLSGARVK
jgi:hypothetical protein